jgi:transcriptional regulator with XRE-family HTH domain
MRNAQHVTLAKVIGANVKRIREESGETQDRLAARLRDRGLNLSRSALALVERGGRNLELSELVIVCATLVVSLNDLLAGDDSVRITGETVGTLETVRTVLANGGSSLMMAALDTPGVRQASEVIGASGFAERSARSLRLIGSKARLAAAVVAEESGKGEAEQKVAHSLRVPPSEVGLASFGLWGHSLTDERERRAAKRLQPDMSPRSARMIRAHVTRELVAELRQRFEEVGS